MIGSMWQSDSFNRFEACWMAAISKVDTDDLSFFGLVGTHRYLKPIFTKSWDGELVMFFWVYGEM